jgi:CubicO group peptidase (beta-lactamase class C family)
MDQVNVRIPWLDSIFLVYHLRLRNMGRGTALAGYVAESRSAMDRSTCLAIVRTWRAGFHAKVVQFDRSPRRNALDVLRHGWKTSTPAEQGLNAATIAMMDAHARTVLPHIRSLLIARHGYLVFEEYYNGGRRDELQNIQSMTKSVTSALVGIAIKQGKIGLDQKVIEFFPEIEFPLDPRVRAMTVRHLLTMSSGIREGPSRWVKDDDNPARSALSQNLDADPGTKFIYSSYASQVLSAILSRVTHQSVLEFADANLFWPLGVSKVVWYKDKSGVELGCGSSLWKATDLLKFGQLYLEKGRWNGTRLIPEWYVSESGRTHLSGDFFGTRVSYGFLWFVDAISGHETYHAAGYGGQYLLIAPALDLVVLCTSDWRQPEYPEHYALLKDFVFPAITDPAKRH